MKQDKSLCWPMLAVGCGIMVAAAMAQATLYVVPEAKAVSTEQPAQVPAATAAEPQRKTRAAKHPGVSEKQAKSRSGPSAQSGSCTDDLTELSLGAADRPAGRCK